MLRAYIPAHILITYSNYARTHKELSSFTHKKLSSFTHQELREKIALSKNKQGDRHTLFIFYTLITLFIFSFINIFKNSVLLSPVSPLIFLFPQNFIS